MITLKNLNVSVERFSLKDISLSIPKGAYFILLGPSGSGKTVLMETIIGLRPRDSGEVFLNGGEISRLKCEEMNISYVPQDFALFPHLDVYSNIIFGAKIRRFSKDKIRTNLDRLSGLLEIKGLLDRKHINGLSQGEKQRIAFARALMVEPDILFMDEPFSNIDQYLRRKLQLKLKEIREHLNITLFQITHDIEEAYLLGDLIGILIQGKLKQVGSREELYHRPSSLEAAKFLLNQNIFQGRVSAIDPVQNSVRIQSDSLQVVANRRDGIALNQEIHFGIRPEEIMVIKSGKPLCQEVSFNLFEGTVQEIFYRGGSHLVMFAINDQIPLELDIPNCTFRELQIQKGAKITVSLKKDYIFYF